MSGLPRGAAGRKKPEKESKMEMSDRSGEMVRINRTSTDPVSFPRSLRGHQLRTLTSMPAGKMVPIAVSPLLREDAVQRGVMRFSFEMHETAEVLLNAVNVNVQTWLVPWLAFDRFESMDEFNKSYEGLEYRAGDGVIDFFETAVMPAHGAHEIYKYLGLHAAPGTNVNTAYEEAYNQIWNHRATNRSPDITLRALDDDTLAPAFWLHEQMKHIVPDFDQAKIDGEVALNIVNQRIPVSGIVVDQGSSYPTTNRVTGNYPYDSGAGGPHPAASNAVRAIQDDVNAGFPEIYGELQEGGITVSLANIELARKTAAFARLREKYSGHSDEFLIDLLMDGITIPEQMWKQPMMLAEKSTIFGLSKRYSSTAGSLNESAVNGATFVDMTVRTPRIPTGGVLMAVAEVTPEQLFERQKDYFFFNSTVGGLPQALRDALDPEKVSVVTNDWIDTDHTDPTATFGYAPLNHEWDIKAPKIGGDYYRPAVDASFDEERQRIWAVETVDPVLSSDFYVCTTMHVKPFADQTVDNFECILQGQLFISGLTQFGPQLIEASDDYAQVLAEADQTRIEKA